MSLVWAGAGRHAVVVETESQIEAVMKSDIDAAVVRRHPSASRCHSRRRSSTRRTRTLHKRGQDAEITSTGLRGCRRVTQPCPLSKQMEPPQGPRC